MIQREELQKGGEQFMRTHTFKIRLANGEVFSRTEWGKTRQSALRTLWGIYGKENMMVLA